MKKYESIVLRTINNYLYLLDQSGKKWEEGGGMFKDPKPELLKRMNDLGSKGWKIVGVFESAIANSISVFMEREIEG